MHPLTEIMLAVSMVLGTFLVVTASVGVVRLPDVFCRMHAAGKAGTLGIVLIIIAAILVFARDGAGMAVRGVLAIFFQFLTIPAATHLLARASYVSDYPAVRPHGRRRVEDLSAVEAGPSVRAGVMILNHRSRSPVHSGRRSGAPGVLDVIRRWTGALGDALILHFAR